MLALRVSGEHRTAGGKYGFVLRGDGRCATHVLEGVDWCPGLMGGNTVEKRRLCIQIPCL